MLQTARMLLWVPQMLVSHRGIIGAVPSILKRLRRTARGGWTVGCFSVTPAVEHLVPRRWYWSGRWQKLWEVEPCWEK